MKIVTYESSRGLTLNICARCDRRMSLARTWPKDDGGAEYARVSHGAHEGGCEAPGHGRGPRGSERREKRIEYLAAEAEAILRRDDRDADLAYLREGELDPLSDQELADATPASVANSWREHAREAQEEAAYLDRG